MQNLDRQAALQSYFEGFGTKCASLGVHPDAVIQGHTLQRITPEVLTHEVLEPVVKAAEAHGFKAEAVFEKNAAWGWDSLKEMGSNIGGGLAGGVKGLYDAGAGVATGDFARAGQGLANTVAAPVKGVASGVQNAVEGTTDLVGSAADYVPGVGQVVRGAGNAINQAAGMGTDTINNAAGIVEGAGQGDGGKMLSNATGLVTAPVARAGNAANAAGQTVAAGTNVLQNVTTKPAVAAQNAVDKGTGSQAVKEPTATPQPTLPATQGAQPISQSTKPAPSTPAPQTPINKGNAPAPAPAPKPAPAAPAAPAPAPAPAAPAAPKAPDNSAQGGVPLNQLTGANRDARLAQLKDQATARTNQIQAGEMQRKMPGVEGKPGDLTTQGQVQKGINSIPGANQLFNGMQGTGPAAGAQTNLDKMHGGQGSTNMGETMGGMADWAKDKAMGVGSALAAPFKGVAAGTQALGNLSEAAVKDQGGNMVTGQGAGGGNNAPARMAALRSKVMADPKYKGGLNY